MSSLHRVLTNAKATPTALAGMSQEIFDLQIPPTVLPHVSRLDVTQFVVQLQRREEAIGRIWRTDTWRSYLTSEGR